MAALIEDVDTETVLGLGIGGLRGKPRVGRRVATVTVGGRRWSVLNWRPGIWWRVAVGRRTGVRRTWWTIGWLVGWGVTERFRALIIILGITPYWPVARAGVVYSDRLMTDWSLVATRLHWVSVLSSCVHNKPISTEIVLSNWREVFKNSLTYQLHLSDSAG